MLPAPKAFRLAMLASLPQALGTFQSDSYPITEEHIKYQDQEKKAANTAAHSRSTVVKPAATPEKKQNDQHDKDCAHGSSFSLSSSQFPACLFQTIRNTANMAG